MARYTVQMPIAGSVSIDVEADGEGAAIEAACERMNETEDCWTDLEWGFYPELCSPSGQFHGEIDRAYVELDPTPTPEGSDG